MQTYKIKSIVLKTRLSFFPCAIWLLTVSAFAESTIETNACWGIPLSVRQVTNGAAITRYCVPFVRGTLAFQSNGVARVKVGGQAKRIFLLGMTETGRIAGWSDPKDYSVRFFVGDELGQIQLNYADGTTQVFPLILGESIWWSPPFNRYPDPFSAPQAEAFAAAIRLYPPAPIDNGNYVAVIEPKPVPLQSIIIKNSPAKNGTPVISGITLELAGTNGLAGAIALMPGAISPALAEFSKKKPLRPRGEE
jgi:hypothetical protein